MHAKQHAHVGNYIASCLIADIRTAVMLYVWLQPALEELAVQNVGCSVNACKSLAELVQNAQELRTLRLYNNMSDDAGATSIAEVSSLTYPSPSPPTARPPPQTLLT